MGELEPDILRDRNGDYESELIPKGTRDVSALEENVLSMYEKSMSDRDISEVINEIYGFWIGENEGAHRWLSIFDELKSRGLQRLGFVCIDGLSGLEEAITSTFPTAVVCRCMAHLARNSTKYIPANTVRNSARI